MHYDKKISEVVKNVNSEECTKECFQDRCGENQNLIVIEAREGFVNDTVSQMKCAAGLNVHGKRAKDIDESNARA